MWLSTWAVGGESVAVGVHLVAPGCFEMLLLKAGIKEPVHTFRSLDDGAELTFELPREFLGLSEDRMLSFARLKEVTQ